MKNSMMHSVPKKKYVSKNQLCNVDAFLNSKLGRPFGTPCVCAFLIETVDFADSENSAQSMSLWRKLKSFLSRESSQFSAVW